MLDPQRLPGLRVSADMLDEGAAGKSALEIADAFEMLGARFGVAAGMHYAQLTLRVPVAWLEQALAVAADRAAARFSGGRAERLRLERLTADPRTTAVRDRGRTREAGTVRARAPYGRNVTEAALRAVGVNDARLLADGMPEQRDRGRGR